MKNDCFPAKNVLKAAIKKAVYEKDCGEWVDKFGKKPELKFYLCSQPSITMNKWYDLWNYAQSKHAQITDKIRLL